MRCLFTRHPDFFEKDLWDIRNVLVAPAPDQYHDYDCFWVERADGSKIDISFNKCVHDKDFVFTRFCKAARRAIQDNLEAFIEQEFREGMECPYSQQPLAPADVMVEHHPLPLELLLMRFVREEGIDLEALEYESEQIFVDAGTVAGLRTIRQFKDSEFADRVADWHADNADMQLISRAVFVYQPEQWTERPTPVSKRFANTSNSANRWKTVLKKKEDAEDEE